MNDLLYEQLVRDNPELFEQGECEFSIGDGWYNIMACLLNIITSDLAQAKRHLKYEKEHPSVDHVQRILKYENLIAEHLKNLPKIVQVKEKYGGLRFYYDGGTEYVAGAVAMAESLADITCEVCGRPGEHRSGNWIRILCDIHFQEQENERIIGTGRVAPAGDSDNE